MFSILVADSQRLFADAMRLTLRSRLQVQVIDYHPAGGLDVVKAVIKFEPDVVLVDQSIEGMNGLAVARQIAKHRPGSKVIVLTNFKTPAMEEEARAAGVCFLLPRDSSLSDVLQAVESAANRAPETLVRHPISNLDERAAARERIWDRLISLTVREIEILGLLEMHSVEDVANLLQLSPGTVRNHVFSVLKKTQTRSQAEAIALGRRWGLI